MKRGGLAPENSKNERVCENKFGDSELREIPNQIKDLSWSKS